jgi:putative ABC transport system substrate-binding protein
MTKMIVVLLVSLTLASIRVAGAEQPARVAKIGWLGVRPAADENSSWREVTQRELRALGYVEGKNIASEYRSAENKLDRLPALADELVRLKVDVLTMSTMSAALAAKNATKTVPHRFSNNG